MEGLEGAHSEPSGVAHGVGVRLMGGGQPWQRFSLEMVQRMEPQRRRHEREHMWRGHGAQICSGSPRLARRVR